MLVPKKELEVTPSHHRRGRRDRLETCTMQLFKRLCISAVLSNGAVGVPKQTVPIDLPNLCVPYVTNHTMPRGKGD
jgi:hypothetical protein